MTERTLKSVVNGFIGTFTSRNSDTNGYWLFGFVVKDLSSLDIDLLSSGSEETGTAQTREVSALAKTRFNEQLAKNPITAAVVRNARLRIQRMPDEKRRIVAGDFTRDERNGWSVRFEVNATSALGKSYSANKTVFVAPHDPKKELRSIRGGS